jgi:L-rhamnose mutarotase
MTVMTARRTRIRPGREDEYRRVHARIPELLWQALRSSGVVRWTIWVDGADLFHAIETEQGYADMLSRIAVLGPVDVEWDALIESLIESEPTADNTLEEVWSMSPDGQDRP